MLHPEVVQDQSDIYRRFDQLLSSLDPADADSAYGWEIPPDSELAARLVDLVQQAPPVNAVQPATAPFRAYADNTDEAWQYVSDDTAREFLRPQRFVGTQFIGWYGKNDQF